MKRALSLLLSVAMLMTTASTVFAEEIPSLEPGAPIITEETEASAPPVGPARPTEMTIKGTPVPQEYLVFNETEALTKWLQQSAPAGSLVTAYIEPVGNALPEKKTPLKLGIEVGVYTFNITSRYPVTPGKYTGSFSILNPTAPDVPLYSIPIKEFTVAGGHKSSRLAAGEIEITDMDTLKAAFMDKGNNVYVWAGGFTISEAIPTDPDCNSTIIAKQLSDTDIARGYMVLDADLYSGTSIFGSVPNMKFTDMTFYVMSFTNAPISATSLATRMGSSENCEFKVEGILATHFTILAEVSGSIQNSTFTSKVYTQPKMVDGSPELIDGSPVYPDVNYHEIGTLTSGGYMYNNTLSLDLQNIATYSFIDMNMGTVDGITSASYKINNGANVASDIQLIARTNTGDISNIDFTKGTPRSIALSSDATLPVFGIQTNSGTLKDSKFALDTTGITGGKYKGVVLTDVGGIPSNTDDSYVVDPPAFTLSTANLLSADLKRIGTLGSIDTLKPFTVTLPDTSATGGAIQFSGMKDPSQGTTIKFSPDGKTATITATIDSDELQTEMLTVTVTHEGSPIYTYMPVTWSSRTIRITGIEDLTDVTLRTDETYDVEAITTPDNATEKVKFSVDDTAVASIDEVTGAITPHAAGTTVVYAKASAVSKQFGLTVTATPYDVWESDVRAIPTPITLASKQVIQNLRLAYDAMSVVDRDRIDANVHALFLEHENTLKALDELTDPVERLIAEVNALPSVDAVVIEDKAKVDMAMSHYNVLTVEDKARVPSVISEKLNALVEKLDGIMGETEKIAYVEALIKALPQPADIHFINETDMKTIAENIAKLGSGKINATLLTKYSECNTRLQELIRYRNWAQSFDAKVLALPEVAVLTVADKPALDAVKDAYNAAHTEAKSMIDASSIYKLNELNRRMVELVEVSEKLKTVEDAITALPLPADLKPENKIAVEQVTALIEQVDSSLLNADLFAKYNACVKEMLEWDAAQISVDTFILRVNALPAPAALTMDHKVDVETLKTELKAMNAKEANLVPLETTVKLDAALKAIEALEFAEEIKVAKALEVRIALLDPTSIALGDEALLVELRKLYTELPDNLKEYVGNEPLLVKCELALEVLLKEQAQSSAALAIAAIDLLPKPEDVTLQHEVEYNKALAVYNQLDKYAKPLVTNYEKLQKIGEEIPKLKATLTVATTFMQELGKLPVADALKLADWTEVIRLYEQFAKFDNYTLRNIDTPAKNKMVACNTVVSKGMNATVKSKLYDFTLSGAVGSKPSLDVKCLTIETPSETKYLATKKNIEGNSKKQLLTYYSVMLKSDGIEANPYKSVKVTFPSPAFYTGYADVGVVMVARDGTLTYIQPKLVTIDGNTYFEFYTDKMADFGVVAGSKAFSWLFSFFGGSKLTTISAKDLDPDYVNTTSGKVNPKTSR